MSACVCMCVYVYMFVRVCACTCVRERYKGFEKSPQTLLRRLGVLVSGCRWRSCTSPLVETAAAWSQIAQTPTTLSPAARPSRIRDFQTLYSDDSFAAARCAPPSTKRKIQAMHSDDAVNCCPARPWHQSLIPHILCPGTTRLNMSWNAGYPYESLPCFRRQWPVLPVRPQKAHVSMAACKGSVSWLRYGPPSGLRWAPSHPARSSVAPGQAGYCQPLCCCDNVQAALFYPAAFVGTCSVRLGSAMPYL